MSESHENGGQNGQLGSTLNLNSENGTLQQLDAVNSELITNDRHEPNLEDPVVDVSIVAMQIGNPNPMLTRRVVAWSCYKDGGLKFGVDETRFQLQNSEDPILQHLATLGGDLLESWEIFSDTLRNIEDSNKEYCNESEGFGLEIEIQQTTKNGNHIIENIAVNVLETPENIATKIHEIVSKRCDLPRSEIDALFENENSLYHQTFRLMQEEFRQSTELILHQEAVVLELKQSLDQHSAFVEQLQQSNEALTSEADALRGETNAMRETVNAMQEESNTLREEIHAWQEQATALAQEVTSWREGSIRDISNDNNYQQHQVGDLNMNSMRLSGPEQEDLAYRLQCAETKNQKLEEELQMLKRQLFGQKCSPPKRAPPAPPGPPQIPPTHMAMLDDGPSYVSTPSMDRLHSSRVREPDTQEQSIKSLMKDLLAQQPISSIPVTKSQVNRVITIGTLLSSDPNDPRCNIIAAPPTISQRNASNFLQSVKSSSPHMVGNKTKVENMVVIDSKHGARDGSVLTSADLFSSNNGSSGNRSSGMQNETICDWPVLEHDKGLGRDTLLGYSKTVTPTNRNTTVRVFRASNKGQTAMTNDYDVDEDQIRVRSYSNASGVSALTSSHCGVSSPKEDNRNRNDSRVMAKTFSFAKKVKENPPVVRDLALWR